MNKLNILLYSIASAVTIILNFLMAFVFTSDDTATAYSNLIVIAVSAFMLWLVFRNGKNVDKKSIKFELYSIWILPFISLVWFINRVFPNTIPDVINWLVIGITITVGTLALMITMKRKK